MVDTWLRGWFCGRKITDLCSYANPGALKFDQYTGVLMKTTH
jgi:hypothetical protein